MEKESAWLKYSDEDKKCVENFSKGYIEFLNDGKTEREAVEKAICLAKRAGYVNLEKYIAENKKIAAGAKIYAVNMGKNVILFNIGTEPLANGMNIVAAHIDSPRLDVKQNPLYEEGELSFLDTHYYGGIKKYQWTAMPLSLHGVVAKKDGTKVVLSVGDKADEPVFCVTDLLPHLDGEQMKKTAAEVIGGEKLDILFGSRAVKAEKNKVRDYVLKVLKEEYDISEEDFISAEIEAVPSGRARSMGLDESMVLGYGQDDRSCAYSALAAFLEMGELKRTACCILTDKEEIGSVGASGMKAAFFENTVAEILVLQNLGGLNFRRSLKNSRALSADVGAAYDSLYGDVFDRKNTAKIGYGLLIKKFTGAGGKKGANDANAEYLAQLRRIFADNGVSFQTMETGKVDAGGGGTIAYILASYGMEIVDCGIPLLSMHAPWEVVGKADLYEAKKGYKAFFAHF
jgi:aspartyl aminopeptidase